MIEFEDDEIKKILKNIDKQKFTDDLKKLILKHGKD
jgi:hypothetical protein